MWVAIYIFYIAKLEILDFSPSSQLNFQASFNVMSTSCQLTIKLIHLKQGLFFFFHCSFISFSSKPEKKGMFSENSHCEYFSRILRKNVGSNWATVSITVHKNL